MAFLDMPVRSDFKAYEFQIDLEGVTYTLRYRFNSRMNRWIMDIADSTNVDLISGLAMLINTDLNRQYVGEDIPPGGFVCIDETGEEKNPEINDLGNDVKLIYRESTT